MFRFRIELILRYLKENNMTKTEFCRRVGISRTFLYRLIKAWEPFIPEEDRKFLNTDNKKGKR